ncbi:MAG: SAM-dependent chlorinase/fluorinase [Candidatus Omnitrophica bacterium]|nr:SAM-dependent chlorinase/fluorinase [Candidatus Omnitrophota bacterium]
MSLIALLTDFGLQDNYAGVLKAVIANINPEAGFVDISHAVRKHDIVQAAFLLKYSFNYFPKNTIFLCIVDPGVGSNRKGIVIETKNYFFVCPNNGIASLAAKDDGIKKITLLENNEYFLKNISNTFHARDIFAPVAAHISQGVVTRDFGKNISHIEEISLPRPCIHPNYIEGQIIYSDAFGNLITNISLEEFKRFCGTKKFSAYLKRKKINKLHTSYAQAKDNEPFLIEGSFSLLEVALKNASAKDFFGAGEYEPLRIKK